MNKHQTAIGGPGGEIALPPRATVLPLATWRMRLAEATDGNTLSWLLCFQTAIAEDVGPTPLHANGMEMPRKAAMTPGTEVWLRSASVAAWLERKGFAVAFEHEDAHEAGPAFDGTSWDFTDRFTFDEAAALIIGIDPDRQTKSASDRAKIARVAKALRDEAYIAHGRLRANAGANLSSHEQWRWPSSLLVAVETTDLLWASRRNDWDGRWPMPDLRASGHLNRRVLAAWLKAQDKPSSYSFASTQSVATTVTAGASAAAHAGQNEATAPGPQQPVGDPIEVPPANEDMKRSLLLRRLERHIGEIDKTARMIVATPEEARKWLVDNHPAEFKQTDKPKAFLEYLLQDGSWRPVVRSTVQNNISKARHP